MGWRLAWQPYPGSMSISESEFFKAGMVRKRLGSQCANRFAQPDYPVELSTDPRTGLPVLAIGRRITAIEVFDALADDL